MSAPHKLAARFLDVLIRSAFTGANDSLSGVVDSRMGVSD